MESGLNSSTRPLTPFEDLSMKFGKVLYNKDQKRDKVKDLKEIMASSGLFLGRAYQEIRIGEQIVYVFDMPSKSGRNQKLLLHGFSAVNDDEFISNYHKILNKFADDNIDAPFWPLPDDVLSYITRNCRSGGVLEI